MVEPKVLFVLLSASIYLLKKHAQLFAFFWSPLTHLQLQSSHTQIAMMIDKNCAETGFFRLMNGLLMWGIFISFSVGLWFMLWAGIRFFLSWKPTAGIALLPCAGLRIKTITRLIII